MIRLNSGVMGEREAAGFLKKNGYKILDTNFRKTFGELDIVAEINDTVVFVEVKTRKSDTFGLPCEFVTKRKQDKLIKTAYAYIEEKKLDNNYRMDIIEVYYDGRRVNKINHIINAF